MARLAVRLGVIHGLMLKGAVFSRFQFLPDLPGFYTTHSRLLALTVGGEEAALSPLQAS